MSNEIDRTELESLGEFGLIDHLTERFRIENESTIKGIGDDAAVIENKDQFTVISTDMLLEGIHFDMVYTPLKHLGYKSVIVNLSDIYAMNAKPKQVTYSIAVSNRFSLEALEELYSGVELACKVYNVDLVGGDTTSSASGLVINVTAIGVANPKNISYRDGAKEGDIVCVTGDLGAAYLGLQVLEREKAVFIADPNMQPELEKHEYLVQRFLKPEARRDLIEELVNQKIIPTSMIDVSDGLSSELFHICTQSKVGCLIQEKEIPISEITFQQAVEFNHDPTMCALNGGEDYEILFTIDPKDLPKVESVPDIAIIGKIVEEAKGLKLETKAGNFHDLKAQGWQHLAK